MITEDYCSYEVAKLLKEKGFNEDCYTFYEYDNKELYREERIPCCNSRSDDYAAPTHQMAMKWLREVHQLHISIKPTWALGDMREPCRWEYDIINLVTTVDPMYYVGKNTYEEAVEAGIKYCLENLL